MQSTAEGTSKCDCNEKCESPNATAGMTTGIAGRWVAVC
jgi:hypothetical protein